MEKFIEMHYFGYYQKWIPQEIYYYAFHNTGFRPRPFRSQGTYQKYASIDDKIEDLHYYTAHVKFGIGRTHYDVGQEIRSKDITTEEGKSLIKKFDGEYPKRFIDDIFKYLSIDQSNFGKLSDYFEEPIINQNYFDDLCDRFRSPHIWKFTNNQWELRNKPYKE